MPKKNRKLNFFHLNKSQKGGIANIFEQVGGWSFAAFLAGLYKLLIIQDPSEYFLFFLTTCFAMLCSIVLRK